MKNKTYKTTAWAIEITTSPSKVFFAERDHFDYTYTIGEQLAEGFVPPAPKSNQGCPIALFTTRDAARACANECYGRTRVVKVSVEVKKIQEVL